MPEQQENKDTAKALTMMLMGVMLGAQHYGHYGYVQLSVGE